MPFDPAKPVSGSPTSSLPPKAHLKSLGDLVCVFESNNPAGQISIAKAQMLFWTVLTLGLFFIKSLQESGLWAVPWEIVALMGMSQAGNVGPKFMPRKI